MKEFEIEKKEVLGDISSFRIAILGNVLSTFRHNIHTKRWLNVGRGNPPYACEFTIETNAILFILDKIETPIKLLDGFNFYFINKYRDRLEGKTKNYDEKSNLKSETQLEVFRFVEKNFTFDEIQNLVPSSVFANKDELIKFLSWSALNCLHPKWYFISEQHKQIALDFLRAKDELETEIFNVYVDELKYQIEKGVVTKEESQNILFQHAIGYEEMGYYKGFAKDVVSFLN